MLQKGGLEIRLCGNEPVGRTRWLLAKRMIAGFNLKRPQEELTAHKGKGWPVRLRALVCREEVGGWQGAEVPRRPVPIACGRPRTLPSGCFCFLSYCGRFSAPREGGG